MPPRLGCYIIVRDAEASIERLLGSIRGYFDELVIVDTGSADRTRERVSNFFGRGARWPEHAVTFDDTFTRVTLHRFVWCDDFSAARQFAFELGSAKWRMYLDADDTFEDIRKFLPMLERTEREHPEANCISLKYDYALNEMAQDVIRCVRWADGWKWEDPLHEHLVPVGHARVISKYNDVWVRHQQIPGHAEHSFARNARIARRAYAEAATPEKRALWAYYLGDYAAELARGEPAYAEAREFYRQAAQGLRGTNMACHALVRLGRCELRWGNPERALELAGQAITHAPELPDGHALLGIALTVLDRPQRAHGVFRALELMLAPAMETMHDAVLLDGLAPAYAAQVALQLGDSAQAFRRLAGIPPALQAHGEVKPLITRTHRLALQTAGLERLKALIDFYLWDAQPLAALGLLKRAPAAISHLPQVAAWRRGIEEKLPHMVSWSAYKQAYASIPPEQFHTDPRHVEGVKQLGRARAVLDWARALPATGSAVAVLSIGAQDCIIEEEVLAANERIHMTVCDVGPQASRGIARLRERFGVRVKTYEVVDHWFDWAPSGARFDAIFMFEVLEHLPVTALHPLRLLRSLLDPEGVLFLSTPLAEAWVEPHLTDPLRAPSHFWHVRAFNAPALWKLFQLLDFTGDVLTTDNDSLLLAKMHPVSDEMRQRAETAQPLSIYVPYSQAFDPLSLNEGHLGGSEEAVVHLAQALADRGHPITVYGAPPEREAKVRVWRGVAWRPVSEFDPDGPHGTVLVWRSPQTAAVLAQKRYRVLNWLHDTHYGATPAQYRDVSTLVLSRAHERILRQLELHGSEADILIARNGVDPDAFPPLREGEEDRAQRVIYASSPDRGLIYLLRMWPEVRAKVPQAELDIYYSWDALRKRLKWDHGFSQLHGLDFEQIECLVDELKDAGVTYRGGVAHPELHRAYRRASVWAYPTGFFEISCISGMKAQAAGCWPIVTDAGALPETLLRGDVLPGPIEQRANRDAFRDKLIERLSHPPSFAQRLDMSHHARALFSWAGAAELFETLLW